MLKESKERQLHYLALCALSRYKYDDLDDESQSYFIDIVSEVNSLASNIRLAEELRRFGVPVKIISKKVSSRWIKNGTKTLLDEKIEALDSLFRQGLEPTLHNLKIIKKLLLYGK